MSLCVLHRLRAQTVLFGKTALFERSLAAPQRGTLIFTLTHVGRMHR